jgi:peptidoglycan/LPS O-acetylase OafA/YrhL
VALSDDEQRRLEEIERALDRHLPRFAAGGSRNQRRERRWVAAAAVMGVGLVVLLTGLVLTQGSVTLGVIVVVAGISIVTAAVALFIGPRPTG